MPFFFVNVTFMVVLYKGATNISAQFWNAVDVMRLQRFGSAFKLPWSLSA